MLRLTGRLQNLLPWWTSRDNSQMKTIVLNPGQGLTLRCNTSTTTGLFDVEFIFTVRPI